MNINNMANKKERPNRLINERLNNHLNEGIFPIIGGIYNRNEIDAEDEEFFKDFEKNGEIVDFWIKSEDAETKGFCTAGEKTYVVSDINEKNKFSKKFFSCPAICAVGIDKDTGENISFLSHQDPDQLLKNTNVRENFKKDLNEKLNDLTNRCVPGSIDIVVLGGNKDVNYGESMNSIDLDKMNPEEISNFIEQQNSGPFEKYRKIINFLGRVIYEKVNFYPPMISGPNSNVKKNDFTHDNALDLYFDTKNRRIYQVRVENESKNNDSYSSNEVNDKIKDYL